MRLGIFAKTFPGTSPLPVLQAVQKAGYSCAQYNTSCSGLAAMPDAVTDKVIADLIAARAETGVALVALSATYNMIHPDPAYRETGLRRLAVMAQAASRLAIPLLTLCTGTRDPHDMWHEHPGNNDADAWSDLCHEMEKAIAIAEKHRVLLGIEPELGNVVNGAANARRLLDDMKTARLKIVFDPANLFETAELDDQRRIVGKAVAGLGQDIAMAHAKDRTLTGAFTASGQGVLDYPHFLTALKSAGFAGPLVAHGLSAAEAPDVAKFLRAACDAAGLALQ